MDEVFKALADPTRRSLLDELYREDGQTLSALEARFSMTRFGVMKHLKQLEEAGLLVTRREGREKLHFLNPVPIRLVHDRWVSKYAEPWAAGLSELKTSLEAPMEPKTMEPKTMEPKTMEPKTMEPKTMEPKTMEPKTMEPKTMEPKTMEPKTMEPKTMEKVFEIYIRTTPERLWEAITDPEIRRKYNFGAAAESDWQVGSPILLTAPGVDGPLSEGEILEVDPPRRLVHSMLAHFSPEAEAEGMSRVTWEIEPVQDSCRLTVIHDQMREGAHDELYGGWPMILSGLKTWLESGELLTTPGSLMWVD